MSNHPLLTTRRDFLRTTVLGGALSWTIPSFLASTFSTMHAAAADSATQIVTGKDSPILVVLQLAGGNDGLNTVVPFGMDDYYKARPSLGIKAQDTLKLSDQIGLNGAMTGMKGLFDSGNLAVINGVGYPNPNRSHFRSTEIWQTAADSNRVEKYGWIGRYFDNACAGADPTVGVNIGSQLPQSFAAARPTGVSFVNPELYKLNPNATADGTASTSESMAGMKENDMAGGSIGEVSGHVKSNQSPLDFLERTTMDAEMSSDKIRKIAAQGNLNQGTYPATPLGTNLRLISRLIAGGLPTRIYYLSLGGFDTHANQANSHSRLLATLSEGIAAFTADLKAQGNFDRVMLLTFSEFGRRVAQNGSGGTDHGTAAPLFITGGKVKGGLYGQYPSLSADTLDAGDLRYTTDFRGIYSGVLKDWMKTPAAPILGREFPPLSVV